MKKTIVKAKRFTGIHNKRTYNFVKLSTQDNAGNWYSFKPTKACSQIVQELSDGNYNMTYVISKVWKNKEANPNYPEYWLNDESVVFEPIDEHKWISKEESEEELPF